MTKPLLTRLKLNNYRCFEQIDMNFHERLTVLVAANGAGKTSILDAIAVAFGPFVGAFDEAYGKGFEGSDIRLNRVRKTSSNEMEYTSGGCSLLAQGYIPTLRVHSSYVSLDGIANGSSSEVPATWKRSLANPKKAKTTIKDAQDLVLAGKKLQELVRTPKTEVVLPMISYYGTGRLWQLKKLTASTLPRTSRTIGYTNSLDPASSYKAFAEWFRYWTQSALEAKFHALQRNQLPEVTEFDHYIASVSRAVDQCLAPAGWKNIQYSMARQELVATHEMYGELPVSLLSDGVRNMLGLVADIAFRATKLNPQFGAEATLNTPGLVLIDEVDMHLHPAWQQVVLDCLLSAFPKLQFIVTTHSPQVLSCVDASSIRVLQPISNEEGKSSIEIRKISQQTKGVASSDLLAEIMGVDPVPNLPEAQQLAQYHALIQQNLHPSDEGLKLRTTLEEHFGADHPVIQECDRMIRLQAFKQKLPLPQSKPKDWGSW